MTLQSLAGHSMTSISRSLGLLLMLSTPAVTTAQSTPSKTGQPPRQPLASGPEHELHQAGERITGRILREPNAKLNYRYELALEAALEFAQSTGDEELRRRVIDKATSLGVTPDAEIPWKQQPFGCFTHVLYRATGDRAWLTGFVAESLAMKRDIWRNAQGVVLHPRGALRGGGYAMLIDAMQEYSARMARTAAASEDPVQRDELIADVVHQWAEYRNQLRNPKTGLWSQGKGWLDDTPDALSPGAWSRGHGWLLRGLVATLQSLPPDAKETRQVLSVYRELCQSLLSLQQDDGSWHALLHRNADESPIDISGTAMIATAFAQGWRLGWLTDEVYLASAKRSFALLPNYVNENAQVISVSPGPGPLQSESGYLVDHFPIDNDHGIFAVLFAAAEAEQLHRSMKD